ncbi:metallophosphoesterase family protein [Maricaulis sp.]|uniref:metallophosphoesterase family protein n=1 Tax=Maricaulis sp. TaxID=1486257 RepID=UPI003297E1C7
MNWLKSILSRKRPVEPPEWPIYAIGDIHGRKDLLDRLLARISAHNGDRFAELVFLGDYVDRGPDSRAVVETLVSKPERSRLRWTFLKGNHEATLMDFLKDPSAGPAWFQYGGGETLMSYGVRPPLLKGDDAAWAAASQAFAAALPGAHTEFLSALELSADRGGYMFVHAGVDPARPLDVQEEKDLLWIRESFLEDSRRLERVIVHGHTPESVPHRDARRIGVDTGAYQTGILTAAVIDSAGVEFLSTS